MADGIINSKVTQMNQSHGHDSTGYAIGNANNNSAYTGDTAS
jgi:hypothetical protein